MLVCWLDIISSNSLQKLPSSQSLLLSIAIVILTFQKIPLHSLFHNPAKLPIRSPACVRSKRRELKPLVSLMPLVPPSQVIAMTIFGLTIAQAKGVKPAVLTPYIKEIAALPDEIRSTLKVVPKQIKKIAGKYQKYEHAIYLGRDVAYPTAMEGALKLKEISYVDANAYALGELKHGPLALIDDRFFELALVPEGPLYDKAISGIQEVLARNGHVVVVTNAKKFDLRVKDIIKLNTSLEIFTPILMNLVSQLLAYYITTAKGYNVDQPRNLAKSVTVE